jgi:hypothetical protein
MKELNHRGLQEDFYKVVANRLEIETETQGEFKSRAIVVFESRDPLHTTTYYYETEDECNQDLDELLKYQQ